MLDSEQELNAMDAANADGDLGRNMARAAQCLVSCGKSHNQWEYMDTLFETTIFAPENGWLEYNRFLLGRLGLFSGAFAVSFRECIFWDVEPLPGFQSPPGFKYNLYETFVRDLDELILWGNMPRYSIGHVFFHLRFLDQRLF